MAIEGLAQALDSLHTSLDFPVPEGLSPRLGTFADTDQLLSTLSRLEKSARAFLADSAIPGRLAEESGLPVTVDDVSDAVRASLSELLYVRGVSVASTLTEGDLIEAVRPRWNFSILAGALVEEIEEKYGLLYNWKFEDFALNDGEGLKGFEALLTVALYGADTNLNRMFSPLRGDFIKNNEQLNAAIFARMKRILLLNQALAPRQA